MKKNGTNPFLYSGKVKKVLLTMKLTMILLLICLIQVSASVYSQSTKFSFVVENKHVLDVLKEIEEKSDYRFFYISEHVDVERKVSIKVNNKTVENILDQLFKGHEVKYEIVDDFLISLSSKESNFSTGNSSQQQKTVSGTVTDSSGIPLPGVTVVAKGTTTGTVTDQDGNFSLTNVSTGATLVFSFVGMKTQELEVAEQSTFNIILEEDAIGIEEVVAIGYGTKKKSHLTGSVESVNTGVLENRPVKSVTEALQGVVPGLNVDLTDGAPESDPNLNIRGFTGFDKDNKPEQKGPLVLVDGIELTLSDINPNDVESISVLKDAAASAIYGSRAPYGVILIKTKSGKRNEKIKVNYNGNLRFGSPINLPSWVDSWVAAEKFNEGRRNMLQGPVYGDEVIQRMKDYGAGLIEDNNISRPDGSWGAHFDAHANTDWFAKTMRSTVPSQQHNFSFSGGSNNTSYYMGLGYNESVGIFKGIGDYKDRYNALLKVNTDATEWLNLSLGMNYIKTDEQGPNGGTGRDYNTFFNGMSRSWPNWPDINPNGSPHWLSSVPLLQGKLGSEGKIRNISTVTGGLLITPIKNWEINGQYTWKHADENYERITLPLTVIRANGTTRPSGRAPNYSEVRREFFASNYHTLDINTSYTKSINNHNFLVMAGYQEEYFRSEKVIASNRDLYTTSVPALHVTFGDNPFVDDELDHWATRGVFGRFSYDYEGKYLIEFNGRYDAHSKFPKDIRWAFFPSVSAGWNIAKENFWPVSQISYFKLRGSYASLGDHGLGNYVYLPTLGTEIGGDEEIILGGNKAPIVTMPGLVSSNLTWAKPRTLGFGVDASAFKNRLELTYDWYQRTTHDLAGPAEPLPETLGTNPPKENNSVTETRGWEFSAKWRDRGFNLMGKPVNYTIHARVSDYVGYVVEYEQNVNGARGSWTPGEVFGKLYVYESNGIAQNIDDVKNNVPQGNDWYYPGDLMLVDKNGDGQVNEGEGGFWYAQGDRVEAGYDYPRYRYGANIGLDWNGFDLSVLLDGVGHWKIYEKQQYVFGSGHSIWHTTWYDDHEKLGTWTPDNPDAFYPRFYLKRKNTDRANEQYLQNLAHLRIKNLRVGYNFSQRFLNKLRLNKLYMYSSIENLGFIYYKSFIKYDPEILDNKGGQGYPPQRVISFGINIGI